MENIIRELRIRFAGFFLFAGPTIVLGLMILAFFLVPIYFIATAPATTEPYPKPPGFEAVFAIAGLLAVAYIVARRKN